MIYCLPLRMEYPKGQAKLIKKLEDQGDLELWKAEFLD